MKLIYTLLLTIILFPTISAQKVKSITLQKKGEKEIINKTQYIFNYQDISESLLEKKWTKGKWTNHKKQIVGHSENRDTIYKYKYDWKDNNWEVYYISKYYNVRDENGKITEGQHAFHKDDKTRVIKSTKVTEKNLKSLLKIYAHFSKHIDAANELTEAGIPLETQNISIKSCGNMFEYELIPDEDNRIYQFISDLIIGTVIFEDSDLKSLSGLTYKPFKVYPNPVLNNLNFEVFDQQIKIVRIFDQVGRLMYQNELININSTNTLDLSEFTSGYYSMVIETVGKTYTEKIIKL